jgi:hypothetical protein
MLRKLGDFIRAMFAIEEKLTTIQVQIAGLERRMDQRIDAMDRRLSERMESADKRLDRLQSTVDTLRGDLALQHSRLLERVTDLTLDVGRLKSDKS